MRITIVLILVLLNGCTIAAQYLGASSATVQLAQTVDIAKITIDAVSTIETGKPVVDHISSHVLDKDCNTFRLFKGEEICVDRDKLNLQIDYHLNTFDQQ
jgi:hypothetical protein